MEDKTVTIIPNYPTPLFKMNAYSKISIITVTYNSAATLAGTIESVMKQDYPNIEYIIVDGNSSDGTVDIIKSYAQNYPIKWISEPDRGLYDAMNKGIRMATGHIVGIINSDDFYHRSDIVSYIANAFHNDAIDCVYGDVRFVNPKDLGKTIRYYSGKPFHPSLFKFGFAPPHPTFFAKRVLFEKYGLYKSDFKISADFELLVRFLFVNQLKYQYLEADILKMRTGGISTRSFKSRLISNREIVRACKENNIPSNLLMVYMRYFIKIFQLFVNKKKESPL